MKMKKKKMDGHICEQIWKCKESGMSLKEIAAKFDMTLYVLQHHLAKYRKLNGLSQKREEITSSARENREEIWKCRESGMSYKEIASKFDMTPGIVHNYLNQYKKQNGLTRKREETASSASQIREQIWKCRESGMSHEEISAKFDIPTNMVKTKLEYYRQLNGLTQKREEVASSTRQREQIWKCRESGMSIKEIAAKFELTPNIVKRRLEYYREVNGLTIRRKREKLSSGRHIREDIWKCKESGMTIEEIATKFGMTSTVVAKHLADHRKLNGLSQKKEVSYSAASQIREQIWNCSESGMSIEEIPTNKFDMTPNIVKKKLNYYRKVNGLTIERKSEKPSSDRHIRDDIWSYKESGMTIDEIATKFGMSSTLVAKHLADHKKLNGLTQKKKDLYSTASQIREQIWDCKKSGMTIKEIATKFNMTPNMVKWKLDCYRKANGLKQKRQKRKELFSSAGQMREQIWKCRESGMSYKEIAAKFNIASGMVHNYLTKYKELNGLIRKREEIISSASQIREQIWNCRESGMSIEEIATKFDIPPNIVKCRLNCYRKLNGLKHKREELLSSARQLREQIWKCRESGMSVEEAAAKFNKTESFIKNQYYYHMKINGIVRNSKERTSARRKAALDRSLPMPTEIVEEILALYDNGYPINEIVKKLNYPKNKIRSVCKKAKAQKLDRAINRLDLGDSFEDSSSSDSFDDDGDDQNEIIEDEYLHPVELSQPSTSALPRKQRALYSRFHVNQGYLAYVQHGLACSTNYKIKLFRLRPFISSIDALLPKPGHELEHEGLSTLSIKKLKKFNTLVINNKLDMAHQLYSYECPDCNFQLVGQRFIPIVYLVIDHFIDCPTHLVAQMVRDLFLEERERFNAFLGANFNHAYALPRDAQLKFFKWEPYETFHCSLSLTDDGGQLKDEKLPIDRQQSFLTDEEAETEDDELDAEEEDNNEIEEDSCESDEECSDSDGSEEEDLDGDDEDEPSNRDETSSIEEFDDLNVLSYDDDSF